MMDAKTRIVNINNLEKGMVIAKNVEENGQLLLKRDSIVTELIIEKLKTVIFIGNIEIYDLEEENEKLEEKKENSVLQNKKQEEYNKVDEEFKLISSKLHATFSQIANQDSVCMDEVRVFSKKIQNELNPSNIVIKNIVLHGSGTDPIYRHAVNVAALSALLGKWLGFENAQLNLLVYSAILHDFGKTKINDEIIGKNDCLNLREFNIVKTHAQIGYNIAKEIPFLDKSVSYGVLMHHEREDGSGYPLGLKGDSIHKFAKIIAIADVFDAINSNRGYKDKKPPFEALQIVKSEGLGKLNYEYVKVFLEHVSNYYMGEEVLLNTGEKCRIIQMNLNNIDKPLLLKGDNFIDLEKEKHLHIKEMLL